MGGWLDQRMGMDQSMFGISGITGDQAYPSKQW